MGESEGIRLQKVLAQAGVGSRRAGEELIVAGRVEVNGQVVTTLGTRVDPSRDSVRVDGKRIAVDDTKVYLVLNKPRGVVSTMSDPQGRRCLGDLVSDRPERLFHVGRLDTDTEGLILLVNDGEFAHRLAHPSYGVQKTYVAEVPGPVSPRVGRALREGVELEDGPARADAFRVVHQSGGKAMVEIVIHEGRKHIVRRMLAEVGHPVRRLARTSLGPVKIGDLAPGQVRPLSQAELGTLLDTIEL
ncbi:23S rRNA pseudouridine2605 synthase [Actinopolymorpha cephalotaxi]|uniref:RNA pseudouridylate synthase n=1 Tax=Actinopolymorpha cephalotaxi TaxID=504797 RepID=A0A1I2VU39_9ACTN|nr:pseudouridine synthase [Actinopolymorpha cephalotaxi]NYH83228.1 23S rRNA pseudouridine2605 synthase [Actinopolymorpha cephalotaxi]SFG91066.1 23S rRNA pseudouridine2605 synthase [Actinopolymorpha cephalotaxi]